MSDYREPWSISDCSQRSVFIDNCGGITVASAAQLLFDEQERNATAERIVDCVNAMQGRDPEKLDALVETVNNLLHRIRMGNNYHDELVATEDALAAFEGEGDTNGR